MSEATKSIEVYVGEWRGRYPIWFEVPAGCVKCYHCKGYTFTSHLDGIIHPGEIIPRGRPYRKDCEVCKGRGYTP